MCLTRCPSCMQRMNTQQCSHSLQDLKVLMSKLGIRVEKNGKLRASGVRVITRCSKKSFAGKKTENSTERPSLWMDGVVESTWYARLTWLWWCCFPATITISVISSALTDTQTHTRGGRLHIAHLAILNKNLVSIWGHLKCWKEPGFEWGKFHGRCLEWWLYVLQWTRIPNRIFCFLFVYFFVPHWGHPGC